VSCENPKGGVTQPHRLFEHRIEHRREVAGRAVDNLQYLGGRGLLLQALAQRLFGRFLRGDVARGPHNSINPAGIVPEANAMLPCPMPCAVGVAIAILRFQPLGFALEVGEDRFPELWHVGGVDTVGPIRHRSQLFRSQHDQFANPRRIAHLAGHNIPLVEALVDRPHRQRVAFFAFAQGQIESLAFGMARGNSLLEIGDDLPRIGRHVFRYRHGASPIGPRRGIW